MTEPVGVETFIRAETDLYFTRTAHLAGGLGAFDHRRDVMDVRHQTVIRANRDTLYSAAVFDLDASPATIDLPEAGNRFMSMFVINQDHYLPVPLVYAPDSITLTRESIGTRYALVGIRTLANPTDATDLDRVHALQDAIKVDQADCGVLETPDWNDASRTMVRNALLTLAGTVPDARRTFGSHDEVDPIRHLIGTASGWGGNREQDATYVTVTPENNDGVTAHELTVSDVPVDGFWSITVYNADGYLEPNDRDVYSINDHTAVANHDGSITIRFGGDKAAAPNVLPIMPGWNYWVRLYRPRPEILTTEWTYPTAEPVGA